MSDEDKLWVLDILRQSHTAQKLGTRGAFTEEERIRWERLYALYPQDYEEICITAKVLYGKKNTTAADEA